jgi:predicted RNA-binding Zn-ribbon protein involved in translation (DUF1610 family)
MSKAGLWACPFCGTVIVTNQSTYPPGNQYADEPKRECQACDSPLIEPHEWNRVSV